MRRTKGVSKKLVIFIFAAIAVSWLFVSNSDGASNKTPVIYTTFYPTQYFAERIGGDKIKVVNPVPEDEDAIFWMPDAKTIEAYQKADLIVINGASFEKWVEKVTLPGRKVIDTAKPFKKDFIFFEHSTTHSHGPSGMHSHEGVDGHTWLDPISAKVQAEEIKKALIKLLPDFTQEFEKGFSHLTKELDELDASLSELAKSHKNQPILASHAAYNYIARRYQWNIVNLDLDPEEMPDAETFAAIKEIMKAHPAKYIIWESYPKDEIATRMKDELGLESIEFSPCELMGEEDLKNGENYFTVMKKNIENIRKIFSENI